jgi:hypothetical protein
VPSTECNLAGSNAHWRKCVWTGTPEECAATFGCVPGGAFVFIWEETGAPDKYAGDGLGNAEHMGVYLGDCALHASSSRGMVAESKFAGKTIPNGGWNRVGLSCWVDYGLSEAQQATVNSLTTETDKPIDSGAATEKTVSAEALPDDVPASGTSLAEDTAAFYPVKSGCRGGAVRRLQTWLLDLGYDLGAYGADGVFGSATAAAVRAFQQQQGLTVDGYVSKRTWAALARARLAAMQEAKG